MDEFEKLLHENLIPLQRYVNFKIGTAMMRKMLFRMYVLQPR